MKLRFADCFLDLAARQLERQGKCVPLEPKVYELLEVLVKRRPAIVPSNELDELLWPNAYVARTSLNRLVSKLRTAVGDTTGNSRVIRTAYKVGYAFCAEAVTESVRPVSPATMELVWGKQVLVLTAGEHLAGRDGDCAFVIDAGTVSRCHARFTVLAGHPTVEDLQSTNGTHVNGTRISHPTGLKPGDDLRLGSERLHVRRRGVADPTIRVGHDGLALESVPKSQ